MTALAPTDVVADPFAELRCPLDELDAVVEADRCLECGGAHAPAPCVVACPADVDVPTFVAQIASGRYGDAARTILAENLLGGTCARVCPVEVLCQGACVLPRDGARPIEIGSLQRFALEHAPVGDVRVVAPPTGWRVAVVGAGPAGMACAGELAALGHEVTVLEARAEPGGLVRFAIAPYRLQREPLPDELALLRGLGVHFRFGVPLESAAELRQLEGQFDALVLAVGMGADVEPAYPGSELAGVWSSLPFVEAIKTGRAPEVGARVVVIGGGNTAIDVAREAVRLGATEVTLAYRRTEADMPAYPHEVEEAREEGVRFSWLTVPVGFRGVGRLQGVECRKARLTEPDASGRRRPEEIPGTEFLLPADTAVLAIGQQPRTELLSWIDGLETDRGLVTVDPETGATGNPKVFAAGDALNGGATVVEAVRTAKIAARGVHAFLEEQR